MAGSLRNDLTDGILVWLIGTNDEKDDALILDYACNNRRSFGNSSKHFVVFRSSPDGTVSGAILYDKLVDALDDISERIRALGDD